VQVTGFKAALVIDGRPADDRTRGPSRVRGHYPFNQMSTEPREGEAKFYSSAAEPGKARPMERLEYKNAIAELRRAVVPIMECAATELRGVGFTVSVETGGALVSIIALYDRPALKGALRFQVHESFAVLVARDPVFWMFTLHCGKDMLLARPGRMSDVKDTLPVTRIVDDFASACQCGLKCRADQIQTYFADLIRRATNGLPFYVPVADGEPLRFATDGEHAFIAWIALPILEAARLCLSRRMPSWRVTVFHPTKGDPSHCSIIISSEAGRSELTVKKQKPTGALHCHVTHGAITFESSPLELMRGESGRFVAVGTFETLLGKFIYDMAKVSHAPPPR
jgi:hypothetical protein